MKYPRIRHHAPWVLIGRTLPHTLILKREPPATHRNPMIATIALRAGTLPNLKDHWTIDCSRCKHMAQEVPYLTGCPQQLLIVRDEATHLNQEPSIPFHLIPLLEIGYKIDCQVQMKVDDVTGREFKTTGEEERNVVVVGVDELICMLL